MAASFESVRRDRRYEVDARGVAEFGRIAVCCGSCPRAPSTGLDSRAAATKCSAWCEHRTEADRAQAGSDQVARVRATMLRIGKRDYPTHSGACRPRVPSISATSCANSPVLGGPGAFLYTLLGLSLVLHVEIVWGEFRAFSICVAILYVSCVIQNLLFLRDIRLGFDRWYAIQEASLTEPEKESPVSRFAVLRWRAPRMTPSSWNIRLRTTAKLTFVGNRARAWRSYGWVCFW